MKRSQVTPELRGRLRFVPNLVAGPWVIRVMRAAFRALPGARLPAGMRREVYPFASGGGVRVFTPASGGNGGALLFIHGGGMVTGTATQEDSRLITAATELDIVTISVEYRLAPEHPFPAALDDCLEAWEWLQDTAAQRGIDPSRVAVGGQSAGGGLAASLAQRIRDELTIQPAAQLLFCPMLDDRTAANTDLDKVNHLLWNNRSNRFGWTAYLGGPPGAAHVPTYAVPSRHAFVAGLPPAWIGTGDIELFFEEDRAYADALTAAGVDTTLVVVPGAPHGFESIAPRSSIALTYSSNALEWLRERLDAPPS